jgi:hypothetical protein
VSVDVGSDRWMAEVGPIPRPACSRFASRVAVRYDLDFEGPSVATHLRGCCLSLLPRCLASRRDDGAPRKTSVVGGARESRVGMVWWNRQMAARGKKSYVFGQGSWLVDSDFVF